MFAVIGAIIAGQGILQSLLYTYPPYISGVSRYTYNKNPNVLPTIEQLVSMRYRQILTGTDYRKSMRQLGFSESWSNAVFHTSRRMLDGEAYVRLWRRGKITEAQLDNTLRAIHVTESDIQRIKDATEYYPSAPDIVRFAVREVYKPAQVDKYGMKQEVDPEYLEAAAKAGLPENIAIDYWAEHWKLPSASQGFEMLHRGVISQDELMELLRALDVMPYWRDKLTAIAYQPLTRVDVRRMHAMGVLDDKETKEAYKHLGYDETNAQRMLEFTIRYNSDDTTGLTRSALAKAYKTGIISLEQFQDNLREIGFSDDTVNFWSLLTVMELEVENAETLLDGLSQQYYEGLIDINQVRAALDATNVPQSYVDTQLAKLELKAAEKVKMPSRSDLTDWLVKGIIDETYYTSQMVRIGYRKEDVLRYLEELVIDETVGSRKYRTQATYDRWYVSGILSEDEYIQLMLERGIGTDDITRGLMELEEKKNEAEGGA